MNRYLAKIGPKVISGSGQLIWAAETGSTTKQGSWEEVTDRAASKGGKKEEALPRANERGKYALPGKTIPRWEGSPRVPSWSRDDWASQE